MQEGMQEGSQDKSEGKKKCVTFIDIQIYESDIDALLFNKIECYNKGVQRSPSCSAKGCTLFLKH